MIADKVLIFDTETTGLIHRKETSIENQPYITQITYMIMSMTTKKVEYEFNSFVKLNDDIEIPEKVVELTGITKKKCQEEGIPIETILENFFTSYNRSDVFMIVAHNIEFDIGMMKIEHYRNKSRLPIQYEDFSFTKPQFCTMRNSERVAGEFRKKQPKLLELYQFLYPDNIEPIVGNLHDSKTDTLLCMKCFIRMRGG
jgi:DNA polymerase III epsilon subunit-like protein